MSLPYLQYLISAAASLNRNWSPASVIRSFCTALLHTVAAAFGSPFQIDDQRLLVVDFCHISIARKPAVKS
ncbi:hypothetical protein [Pseudomonas gingeri]|uniref:hypothetical protein n=1 Tax=Pseudomonas gingeri TaxID=117681 RepID=UPI0015A3F6ED|nr:hypothetical protein [Pseudomonas gingeri]NWA02715.1 hypothetical protein [Pseudomonas gingeri]NWA12111.1 hypothetical protein [Pseudomonas gingeri]NWA57482.1 hypothetical protein [Pseudomonas gingeri]NWA93825.1 hypothetical protein [Pseudomonas gingeri]NWB03297.1 hypothetical protein [Pseudomonas gingeri]